MNTLKKIGALLMVLVMIAALCTACGGSGEASGQSGADTSLTEVQEKGYFTLGLDDTFLPMGFRDADTNEIVGFDIDLAKAVAEKMGVEVRIQPIDWNSNETELNTKNIDCIWNGMSVNEEREASMNLSIPYMNNEMILVVRRDSGITSLKDLSGKMIAVQSGSPAAEAVQEKAAELGITVTLVEFAENNTAMMDLEMGASDAVCTDSIFAGYYIEQTGKAFTVLDEVMSSEQYAIGFRKNDVALTEAVNEALRELKEDGTLAEISEKWFGRDLTVVE